MATTFADVYGAVLLRVPGVDPLLAREWVQETYIDACDEKLWSHQRAETAITVRVSRTGTATATLGLATLAAGTLTFSAADVGRQIRLESVPLYTIIDVTAGVPTLDRTYSETSGVGTFTVLDAYWTAPLDFWRFLVVIDPTNKWKLRYWVTEEQLNQVDPGRMSTGSPWCLASQRYSPVVADQGRSRFELFPYLVTARSFPVMYYTKPTVLTDDDVLIGPFARGGKALLIDGALAKCSLWPGTEGAKNPYFNLALADKHERRYQDKLQQLEVKDEDMYPTYMPLAQYDWAATPWDAAWLQSHVPQTIDSY